MKFFLFIACTSVFFLNHINANGFFEEHEHLIVEVIEDRVYLDRENISIEENAFNITDRFGIGFKVNELFFDARGIYTTFTSVTKNRNSKVWNIVYCKTCKTYRSINIQGKCNICGNSPFE